MRRLHVYPLHLGLFQQHQRKGWGSVMIEACLEDAKTAA